MRLTGYDGLATAIVLQAAKDYVMLRRWMIENAQPFSAKERIIELRKKKDELLFYGHYKQSREIQREIMKIEEQAEKEIEIDKLVRFFHSKYYDTICAIDGEQFLRHINERIEQDPKFKVVFGDDI